MTPTQRKAAGGRWNDENTTRHTISLREMRESGHSLEELAQLFCLPVSFIKEMLDDSKPKLGTGSIIKFYTKRDE